MIWAQQMDREREFRLSGLIVVLFCIILCNKERKKEEQFPIFWKRELQQKGEMLILSITPQTRSGFSEKKGKNY